MASVRLSIGRVAAFECRMLFRAVGWPILLAMLGIAALLLVQEPTFARRYDAIPFVATGVEAALIGACAMVPLAWILLRRRTPVPFVVRPAATVAGWTLGITGFATGVAAIVLAALLTVDRIQVHEGLGIVVRLVLVTASLAALAPAIASFRPTGAVAAFSWSCLVAASLGIFGIGLPIPADRVLGGSGVALPHGAAVAAAVLSLLAGLSVSTLLVGRRLG